MSDDQKDVMIAAYLFEDLAKKDFDVVVRLAEDKKIEVEGVVLVQKDSDGELHVSETGDHLGRAPPSIGVGIGGKALAWSATGSHQSFVRILIVDGET